MVTSWWNRRATFTPIAPEWDPTDSEALIDEVMDAVRGTAGMTDDQTGEVVVSGRWPMWLFRQRVLRGIKRSGIECSVTFGREVMFMEETP